VKRGDLVAVVLPGRYGKPRPGLVVQEDAFEALPSVTVLPLTSDLRGLLLVRVPVEPGEETGLRIASEVQVDKIMTVPRGKIGPRLGSVDDGTMRRVDEALARFLGLGGVWRWESRVRARSRPAAARGPRLEARRLATARQPATTTWAVWPGARAIRRSMVSRGASRASASAI